jgi:hypothetical protein
MTLDPRIRRRLSLLAALALLLSAAALWFPSGGQAAPQPGGWTARLDLGPLKPAQLTWESSDRGFWLAFTNARLGPLFVSLALTVAACVLARQILRRRSTPVTG